MIKTRITRWAAAVISGGVLALITTFGGAAAANASTVGCSNSGAFAGYCGTQVNGSQLAINVKGGVAFAGQGATVVGYDATVAAPGSDFIWQALGNGAGKEAIFAPNGVPFVKNGSNLCLSEPGVPAVQIQLRYCNGNKFQTWNASDDDTGNAFEWTNLNSGRVLSSTGNTPGHNLLVTVPAPAQAAPATSWVFTTAAG